MLIYLDAGSIIDFVFLLDNANSDYDFNTRLYDNTVTKKKKKT